MKTIQSLFLLLFSTYSFAQIANSGFESNNLDDATGSDCRSCNGCDNAKTITPFNSENVAFWFASHGSPQLNKSGCNGIGNEGTTRTGLYSAFLFSSSTFKEGIFQNKSIKKNQSYNFSIYINGFAATSKVIIAFANGLSNSDGSNQSNLPVPNSKQIVIEQTLSSGWQEIRSNEFVADDNYTQLWIYAEGGSIAVDDVMVDESCCEPHKIYQNVYDPPNTHVNDYIIAGKNVTSASQGDVVIKTKPETTTWTATNEIELFPGFVTESGADFLAEIKPCREVPMQIFVSEIVPQNASPQCTRQYEAVACFGSGSYKYTWDTDHAEHLGSQKTKLLWPATDAQLGITVTDLWTNEVVTKYITVEGLPFIGDFNITAYNLITPNGDGSNDEWRLIDETRLNQQKFGYNAYKYELEIERQDITVFNIAEENKTLGFAYNQINWNGMGPNDCGNFLGGNQYYTLFLKNCTNEVTYNGNITVLCPPPNLPMNQDDSIKHLSNNADIESSKAEKVMIYPNPSKGDLTITVSKVLESDAFLQIYDITGKVAYSSVLKAGESKYSITDNNLVNGNYVVTISADGTVFNEKLTILKE